MCDDHTTEHRSNNAKRLLKPLKLRFMKPNVRERFVFKCNDDGTRENDDPK